jgi:hypothetical protein
MRRQRFRDRCLFGGNPGKFIGPAEMALIAARQSWG